MQMGVFHVFPIFSHFFLQQRSTTTTFFDLGSHFKLDQEPKLGKVQDLTTNQKPCLYHPKMANLSRILWQTEFTEN